MNESTCEVRSRSRSRAIVWNGLIVADNILITCYTLKNFGVAKKPRGLYCRTKLKTMEWQIFHLRHRVREFVQNISIPPFPKFLQSDGDRSQ